MHRAVPRANNQGRFRPRLPAHSLGQIRGAHHSEQAEQRSLAFAQRHRPASDNRQSGRRRATFDSFFLFVWRDGKHAREKAAMRQMPRRDGAIIRDVTTNLEPAGDLLRVVAFNSGAQREIRRTAEHQVEPFVRPNRSRIPEIALPNLVSLFQSVPCRGLSGESNTFRLRLDRNELRSQQPPRGNHPDGSDPAAQIEHRSRRGTPTGAEPGRHHVIRRKAVSIPELEQTKMPADGIQCLALGNCGKPGRRPGRNRARLGPTFEEWLAVHDTRMPVRLSAKQTISFDGPFPARAGGVSASAGAGES